MSQHDENTQHVEVAIVGGGFSGLMVASHLARAAGPAVTAILLERDRPGGVAYGTRHPLHLLNIPIEDMSAWPEDPSHFASWVQSRSAQIMHAEDNLGPVSDRYMPRGLYGEYLQEVFQTSLDGSAPGRIVVARDEAIGLLPAGAGFRLRLASGRLVMARRVVLALGQFPPAPLRVAEAVRDCPWYVEEPWSAAAQSPLGERGEALLVGTGLTAVDVAVALLEASPGTRVHLVSRRAQLPAAQREAAPYRDWLDPATAPTRVSELAGLIRGEVRSAGVDWRSVVDALKPHLPALWARMPLVERRRFLRHARTYWEAHRNRLPPPTAERVARYRAEGRLVLHAARLRTLEEGPGGAEATLARRGGGETTLRLDRVVNCTGPDTQYRQINHPLVMDLIGTGLARPDPLGLGLDVAPDGRLKDEDGLATRPLYTLGWPRQGQLWEATTVPSLREQAQDVARRVLQS